MYTTAGARSPWRRAQRHIAIALVVVVTAGLGMAASAVAESAVNQRFTVVAAPPAPDRVVASGVLNDTGTDSKTVQPGPGGTLTITATWSFHKGTLFVVAHGKVISQDTNTSACIRTERVGGTFEITGGDGAYQGVTGGGTFTARNLFIGTRSDQVCSFMGVRPYQVVQFQGTIRHLSVA
ncbi:MAG: hypothetical protein ACR2G7_12120 [Acidimicrobiales bacterium]